MYRRIAELARQAEGGEEIVRLPQAVLSWLVSLIQEGHGDGFLSETSDASASLKRQKSENIAYEPSLYTL